MASTQHIRFTPDPAIATSSGGTSDDELVAAIQRARTRPDAPRLGPAATGSANGTIARVKATLERERKLTATPGFPLPHLPGDPLPVRELSVDLPRHARPAPGRGRDHPALPHRARQRRRGS